MCVFCVCLLCVCIYIYIYIYIYIFCLTSVSNQQHLSYLHECVASCDFRYLKIQRYRWTQWLWHKHFHKSCWMASWHGVYASMTVCFSLYLVKSQDETRKSVGKRGSRSSWCPQRTWRPRQWSRWGEQSECPRLAVTSSLLRKYERYCQKSLLKWHCLERHNRDPSSVSVYLQVSRTRWPCRLRHLRPHRLCSAGCLQPSLRQGLCAAALEWWHFWTFPEEPPGPGWGSKANQLWHYTAGLCHVTPKWIKLILKIYY